MFIAAGDLDHPVAELALKIAGHEIKGAYAPGEEQTFFQDLRAIVHSARSEVFIVDNSLDATALTLFMHDLPAGLRVRIMTGQPDGNLLQVARRHAQRGNFELRSTREVQDGVIFVDGRSWVIGQSVRDAASGKPSYIVEFDATRMRPIYEVIWKKAEPLVRG